MSFIEEVAKNNALQREFLTEKQHIKNQKEIEKKQKFDELQYKKIYNEYVENCKNNIYIQFVNDFKNYGSLIYNQYNNHIFCDKTIKNIIDNDKIIKMLFNNDDIEKIKIILQKYYFAELKKQYNIQKNIEKSMIELETQNEQPKKQKSNIFLYIIFGFFIFIITFINQLFKPHTLKGMRKRRRY